MEPTGQSERVVVVVAEDGMSAWASVITGYAAGAAELDAALAQAGVCFGIDPAARDALAAALADSELANPRVDLAVGQLAEASRDGWFEPSFHVGIQPGHLAGDGTMDFYDRELLKPAVARQTLGRMHAPVAGADGHGVRGEVLAAPVGSPAALRVESGSPSASTAS